MNHLRRIPLDGCVNFRDLGGYASSLGGTTKWGVLYRADSLHRLNSADAEVVPESWAFAPQWTCDRFTSGPGWGC